MSKLTEWLKLIPEGIKDAPSLIEGVINDVKLEYGTLSEDAKEEIIKRRLICKSCPFNSENSRTSNEYKEVTGSNYGASREDLHCAFCGCPISTRTASLSKACGITAWNKNHKNKLPLKWEVYGKNN